MHTRHFLELLLTHPDHHVRFILPDGSEIPPHFHITEVGHAAKRFIDCGGKRHSIESCLLQIWLADDTDHRLKASKLAAIFERGEDILPSTDLPVEIEHEAPVLTQLPITGCDIETEVLRFQTEFKHTDCLAKDVCLPDFSLPALPGQPACNPASGCC